MIRVTVITMIAGVGGTGYWAMSSPQDSRVVLVASRAYAPEETYASGHWPDQWGGNQRAPAGVTVMVIQQPPPPMPAAPVMPPPVSMAYPDQRTRLMIDRASGYAPGEWIDEASGARATRGTRPMANPAIGPRLRQMMTQREQAAASRPTAETLGGMP